MACNNTGPPILNSDGSGYRAWKKDIRIWCQITKVPVNTRTFHIYLKGIQQAGKAKQVASQLSEDRLKSSDGVKILMEALDKAFLPEKPMRLFNANNRLKETKRKSETKVHDFIIEFDNAKFEAELEGLSYDDSLLGLNLLDQCQISKEKQQLVMSGLTEVTYDGIKHKLQTIFFNEHNQTNNSNEQTLENQNLYPESTGVFYSGNYNRRRRQEESYPTRGSGNRGRKRGRYSGSGRNSERNYNVQTFRKINPEGRDGKITKCNICESKFHWARNCPDAYENQRGREENNSSRSTNGENVLFNLFVAKGSENVTMFSGPNETKENGLKALRMETNGHAIIDSGCATNVCGEAWLENFKESLTSDDKRKITEEPSNQKFTFGIGGTAQAKLRVRVPCWLNGKCGFLTTDVIENDIPLLLSRESL